MTPSQIHTIRGGEIIPTFRGKTVTKGTTTIPAKGEMAFNANTLTKDSKVRGSDNNLYGGKKRLEEMFESFMARTENITKNQDAAIKNLETQVGQLAKQISERPAGEFPGDTQNPSTEHAFAITTRSG